MAAVQQFPDILRADEYNDERILPGEELDLPWSPSTEYSETPIRAFARFSMNSSLEEPHYRVTDLQQCTESSANCSIIDAPHAWQRGSPDWYRSDCLQGHTLYDLKHPHDTAANGRWTPIDQETLCSGGGSWSPHTVDSRSDAGASYGQRHWSQSNALGLVPIQFGGSSEFHSSGTYQRPSTTAVISPHDLQQYPDTISDAPSPRADPHHVRAGHSYFPEEAHYYIARGEDDHFIHEDEGLGSSIHDGSKAASKSVSVKLEEDLEEEDDDAEHDNDDIDADWSPRIESLGQGRRLPRKCAAVRNPTGGKTKRAQTARTPISVRGNPARIAKKPSSKPLNIPSSKNTLLCPHCPSAFPSDSTLKKHVLAIHTRPFICTFSRYGCDSTVGSKNEWKRHINVQHMRLETWRCDMGSCAPVPDDFSHVHGRSRLPSQLPNPSASGLSNQETPSYVHEFDRKDLFTQHMKRMHAPHNNASRADKQAFENGIEAAQIRCHQNLRDAPTGTRCPYCADVFFESWDERIEHVGKHLEKQEVELAGGAEDYQLRRWMEEQGFIRWTAAGGYQLAETGKKKKRAQAVKLEEGLEDAEGDEE